MQAVSGQVERRREGKEAVNEQQQQALEAVAGQLGRTLSELAEQIWAVAEKVEEFGNRGYEIDTLKKAGLITDFLENKEMWSAVDGILFYRVSDGRRDPFEGWMVRRKPSWQSVWCNRFGGLNADDPHGCRALAAMSEAARKAKEEMIPRPDEFIVFRRANTLTAAELGAYAELGTALGRFMFVTARDLLMEWRGEGRLAGGDPPVTAGSVLYRLFETLADKAADELRWRQSVEKKGSLARRSSDDSKHEFIAPEARERVLSGEITLKELAALVIDWPVPALPEVLHVDDERYKRIPDREKVYIDKKTRQNSASIWAYPFKANSEENGIIRHNRYMDWLRSKPDLLAQLEDLRGKRALGVLYKPTSFNYDEKAEIGHGEVLLHFLGMDEDKLHDLIQEAIERTPDKS